MALRHTRPGIARAADRTAAGTVPADNSAAQHPFALFASQTIA